MKSVKTSLGQETIDCILMGIDIWGLCHYDNYLLSTVAMKIMDRELSPPPEGVFTGS